MDGTSVWRSRLRVPVITLHVRTLSDAYVILIWLLLGSIGAGGSGCPVPGPQMDNNGPLSCYSSCCYDAAYCENGALPAGGGGCYENGAGPYSWWYNDVCPNVAVSGTGAVKIFFFDPWLGLPNERCKWSRRLHLQ